MIKAGTLYLIPNTIGGSTDTVSPYVIETINKNKILHFAVEEVRSARRFLSLLGIKTAVSRNALQCVSTFYEIGKHSGQIQLNNCIDILLHGQNMGLLSEAGCPGIADPGAELVHLAHQNNINVTPLAGPSSIILALMASGLNGQQFAFHGYLPKERKERIQKLLKLEKAALTGATQIFIETPYRSQYILEDFVEHCNDNTRLCVASDLTLPSEFIKTKTVNNWKGHLPDIHKRPTVFLMGR